MLRESPTDSVVELLRGRTLTPRPRDPGRGSWGAICFAARERGSVSVVKKYSSTTSAFLRLVAEDGAALKGATQPTGNPWASPTSNRCDLTCPVAPPLTERQGGADSMGDTTTTRLRGRYRRAASQTRASQYAGISSQGQLLEPTLAHRSMPMRRELG